MTCASPSRRPRITDEKVIEVAAEKWAESALERGDLNGWNRDAAHVGALMERAARRAIHMDPHAVASKFAEVAHDTLSEETINLAEAFLAVLEKVHHRTVSQWLTGWGPEQPFEETARIWVKGRGVRCGIGFIFRDDKKLGRCHFVPDEDREAYTDVGGFICSYQIVNWEEVESVSKLLNDDIAWIEKSRAAEILREERTRQSDIDRQAKHKFALMVTSAGKETLRPESGKYAGLCDNPHDAAKIVAHLKRQAEADLKEMIVGMQEAKPSDRLF